MRDVPVYFGGFAWSYRLIDPPIASPSDGGHRSRVCIVGNRSQRKVEPPPITPTEEMEAQHYGAWQEWQRGLTPDEKVAMEKDGLTAPEAPRKGRRAPLRDPEEDPTVGTCDDLASEKPDPFEALARKEEAATASAGTVAAAGFQIDATTRQNLSLLTYVLPAIIDAENPRLEASLLALALEIGARQKITYEGLRERHNRGISWMERKVREWQVHLDICRASLTLLRVVISPILASRNPRLEADCISMAAQFGLSGGVSMTALGEHHGVCKAAISARVRRWCKKFHLPLPRDCKQSTANYILSNVRREKPKAITL